MQLYNILKLKRTGKPFKIIVKNFKINDANWVESFINDYKNINNQYTEFCNRGIFNNHFAD